MRTCLAQVVLAWVSLALLTSGCRRKAVAPGSADLEAAASKFPTAESAPTPVPPSGTAPAPAPAQEMKEAVQAYKGGQFEDAVTRLRNLRARPGMTAQQYMALNDVMATVMADLNALAAKGDQRAIQAIKQYEKMQTQGR